MCLAIPGRIETIVSNEPLARVGKVDFGGICKDVNLSYTPEAGVGDYVIVHVGFAISSLDEKEAQRTLAYLEQIGAADQP